MTPSRTLKKWTITGYFTIISRISWALLVYNDHLTHNANTIVKEILSYRIEMSKVQKLSFSPRLWPIYLYCAAFIIIISRGINYVQVWWRRRRTTQSVRYLYHLSTTVQRRVVYQTKTMSSPFSKNIRYLRLHSHLHYLYHKSSIAAVVTYLDICIRNIIIILLLPLVSIRRYSHFFYPANLTGY